MKKPQKTQDECRRDAITAARAFLDATEEIDDETPWSEREPSWWVEMIEMQKVSRQFIVKHQT